MEGSATGDGWLALLGGFELRCQGDRVRLALGAHRLLSYLALREGGAQRTAAAEALWPHRRGGRAAANLRSALWQARSIGRTTLVDCVDGRIRLSPAVRVDLREALRSAHEITRAPDSAYCRAEHEETVAALARDLLPEWSDEWLLFAQQRWDQVRLHALEVLARQLISARQYLAALEAAMTAVAIEPLRESANRTVMEAHIAEGNSACAIKHYQRYRGLMRHELGVASTPQMDRLVRPLLSP